VCTVGYGLAGKGLLKMRSNASGVFSAELLPVPGHEWRGCGKETKREISLGVTGQSRGWKGQHHVIVARGNERQSRDCPALRNRLHHLSLKVVPIGTLQPSPHPRAP